MEITLSSLPISNAYLYLCIFISQVAIFSCIISILVTAKNGACNTLSKSGFSIASLSKEQLEQEVMLADVKLKKKLTFCFVLAWLSMHSAIAATFTMASGSQPVCSSGAWTFDAPSTYTCSGSMTLASGDSIVPSSSATIRALAGLTLAGNNTVGSGSAAVNLQTTYGDLTIQGGSVIHGGLSAQSGSISISNSSVTGAITGDGTISTSGGSVGGSVNGKNGVTAHGTAFGGNVTSSNGTVSLTGGSVAGNVTSSGGSGIVIQGGVAVTGNVTSNCCTVIVDGSSVSGAVVSNGGNGPTVRNGSTVGAGVTSTNSTVTISGSTVTGPISTSGGDGVNISNSTIPSGSVTTSNVPIVISNSTLGSPTSNVNVSNNHRITISNGSVVYGNVNAASWHPAGSVVDGSSTVYGVCTSSTVSTDSPISYGNRCQGAGSGMPSPASFNAFETSTGSNAVTGPIRTKVAGNGFTLAIVAINSAARMTSFTGQVKAELLANDAAPGTAYGSNNCPLSGTVLGSGITTANFTTGRTDSAAFPAVSNVYRDVRVRISYPATGTPTAVACSTNSFAIRPASLSVVIRDADTASAGSARTLTRAPSELTVAATPYHKAGRPFRLEATAHDAAAAVTSRYRGSALAVHSLTPIAPATVAGTLTVGALSAVEHSGESTGTVRSDTASYSDVGAFTAVLRDTSFAVIDSDDTPADCNGYWICSESFNAGRFVPDFFEVSSAVLTPTCVAAGKTAFTYSGAPMGISFTLTARNAAGGITQNYAGSLAKLNPGNSALWSKAVADAGPSMALGAAHVPTVPTSNNPVMRLGYGRLSVSNPSGSWLLGSASITASVTFARPAETEMPYESFRLGIAPKDSDGVTVQSSALNLDAEDPVGNDRVQLGQTAMRLGRLRLSNAFGSEKASLGMPVQAHYWTGNSWMVNGDDSCTKLLAGNFHKTNGMTNASDVALVDGKGTLMLSAPGAGVTGSVDIAANLGAMGSGSDHSCLESHGGTPANLPWLRSRNGSCATTFDRDPSARATFGIHSAEKGRVVHARELF